jgi:hypothetical protein
MAGISFKTDPLPSISTLVNITKSDSSHKLNKQLNHNYKILHKILIENLSPDKIAAMIKYISNNPYRKLDFETNFFTILDSYKKRIKERYLKNKDIVLRQHQENNIQNDIKALFGEAKLLPINGYTDELNILLEKFEFDAIKNINAMRIMKSFIIIKFEKEIKDNINRLIVEGFFRKKEYQNFFSTIFYKASESTEKLTALEEMLSSSPQNSFHSLNILLSQYQAGKKNENIIKKTIDVITEKIELQ